ncbi:Gfo/Idh/MocA family oxidoreductase [Streptomyces sp. NPDC048664]|uniref:Gfo/Idh/MocA family protein n=1 Tax=Streptomyces sp. NPDC048664 TaxID=3154505 RepID=UPI00344731B1
MTAALRVGLLGHGWVNRTVWLPRVRSHPRLELAAVHDPEAADVPSAASWSGFWEARPDVVVVGTPNHTHAALASAALERGIPVVVEKPLCLSRTEFDTLAEQARGSGLLVSRAAVRREDVRRLADSTPAGPLTVRASWLRADGVPRPGSWFTGRARAGGGALLDLGWHLADVALGLLGRPRLTSVTARLRVPEGSADSAGERAERGGPYVPGRAAWRGDGVGPGAVDVEVDGTLSAAFEGGARLLLRAAWESEAAVDTTRFAVTGGGEHRELTGTFGFSPNRVAVPALTAWNAHSYRRVVLPDAVGQEYDAQLEAIVAFASGRLDWEAELAESAAVLDLLEAAYRAAGRPLLLPAGTVV